MILNAIDILLQRKDDINHWLTSYLELLYAIISDWNIMEYLIFHDSQKWEQEGLFKHLDCKDFIWYHVSINIVLGVFTNWADTLDRLFRIFFSCVFEGCLNFDVFLSDTCELWSNPKTRHWLTNHQSSLKIPYRYPSTLSVQWDDRRKISLVQHLRHTDMKNKTSVQSLNFLWLHPKFEISQWFVAEFQIAMKY